MTDLAERLTVAMAGPPEVKPSELARACGIRQPSINDWLSGRTKKLEGSNLLAAAEFLKVNPWWLANGTGPMRSAMPEADVREIVSILQSMNAETRRIAWAQIKALADLTSEKVNSVTAEKSGTISRRDRPKPPPERSSGESGVTSLDEAVSMFEVQSASQPTKISERKSRQS